MASSDANGIPLMSVSSLSWDKVLMTDLVGFIDGLNTPPKSTETITVDSSGVSL